LAPPDPQVVLDRDGITATVDRLAAELNQRHEDGTILVSVLKGSLIFTSDLARRLTFHPLFDFMAVSSYESGRRVHLVKDLTSDITGADVVLCEDVIDTGLSLQYLLGELAARGPRSLSVCAFVDKPHRRLLPVSVDHVGVTSDADFLIGYGLDFAGRYRNLDRLAVGDLTALTEDPDCYRDWAYGKRPRGREDGSTAG
jgi:hypoxanthine phosphoribosyltransferase